MMINDWSENDLWWSSIREPFSVIIIQRVTFVILIVIINDLGFWLWSSVITSVIANYECDRRLRVWSPITSVIADYECDRQLRVWSPIASVIVDYERVWSSIMSVIINHECDLSMSGMINDLWFWMWSSMMLRVGSSIIIDMIYFDQWSSILCAIIDDLQFHVQS